MVIREDARQHKSRVELATDSEQKHLLTDRGSPPHPRATGATGEPVQPGGLHSSGLDTTKPPDGVNVGHNAGADEISDRASDILQRIYIIHEKKDAVIKSKRLWERFL